MNVYEEDSERISESIDWSSLEGKKIFLTGATGLIGATLLRGIARHNLSGAKMVQVVALVRSIDRAKAMFGDLCEVQWFEGDINYPIDYDGDIDYIIHGASETSSRRFVNEPVEVIKTSLNGTMNILEMAKKKKVKSVVYLSSMEIYGAPQDDSPIDEHNVGKIDSMAVRSSYPESKRMGENMCVAYCSEYGVPVKIARLTQTFGPGIKEDDNRVFAQFAKAAIGGSDIVLCTAGDTKRMYIYTAEAAIAIITILMKGNNGEAYNVANPDTYCSIREMAELVVTKISKSQGKVIIQKSPELAKIYASEMHMFLDVSKLEKLGFRGSVNLETMFNRMIAGMI